MGTKAKMTISRAVSILNREKPVFLEGLSPAEVQMVVTKASLRRYPAYTGVTNEAYSAKNLFLLLEGAARVYTLTPRRDMSGWAGSALGDCWGGRRLRRSEMTILSASRR